MFRDGISRGVYVGEFSEILDDVMKVGVGSIPGRGEWAEMEPLLIIRPPGGD